MTLLQVIKSIERVAASQPSVNMIVENDIFRINKYPDAKYGIFAWLQNQHSSQVGETMRSFSFTFFYVDRLKADLSNQIEIQSVGIDTLANIIGKLDVFGIETDQTITYQVFNQRFQDECAGVWCNVTFSVPVGSLCPEAFGDFNDDFNDDFLIL